MPFGISINQGNTFHGKFYYLRADQESPHRAEDCPVQGVDFLPQQEIGYELPTAWREDRRELCGNIRTVFASQRSTEQAQPKKQRRKKGQEHIEGHGLRHHTALRNDSCQRPEQFLCERA